MKPYEKTIRDYKKIIQESCIREEAVKRTVEACRSTLQEQPLQEKWVRTSYFEFLYEQDRFIKKRWWMLQGAVLAFLWFWMSRYAQDSAEMTRLMGVIAVVFVILIVPELWKNRKHGVGEIELASVYNLRQISTARVLIFAAADLGMILLFMLAVHQTMTLSVYQLGVNFVLPVNVAGCICFRILHSRWGEREYLAVFLCLVWTGIWIMIITRDAVYLRVAEPVWATVTLATLGYLVFCIQKSLQFDEKRWEEHADGITM